MNKIYIPITLFCFFVCLFLQLFSGDPLSGFRVFCLSYFISTELVKNRVIFSRVSNFQGWQFKKCPLFNLKFIILKCSLFFGSHLLLVPPFLAILSWSHWERDEIYAVMTMCKKLPKNSKLLEFSPFFVKS